MKKAAPVIIVVILGLGLGVMVWWVTRSDPVDPPIGNCNPQANEDFSAADFIPTFDLNDDGQVTFEEFNQRYGKPLADNSPPMIFHEDNDGPALDAQAAFKRWDRDANGIVNAADMQRIENKAWRKYQDEAEKKRLKAVTFGDKWMMLNAHQHRTYETEQGALARDEHPFAGKFWKARYLGNWATLVDEDGETHEGFISRSETRIFLLTNDAKLSVYDPAKVTVSEAAEGDPHNKYAAQVKQAKYFDIEANLELAGKCLEWGMTAEAGMLFARVLVFDGTNKEALAALGYTEKDGHYFERGN